MKNKPYFVTLLGDFSVTCNNTTVSDRQNRSKKPWNLIEYILVNHGRFLHQNELLALIWSDDTEESSAGALKVLLHRARKLLEPVVDTDDSDLIILKKGEYFWNSDCETSIDAEVFASLFKKAEKESSTAKKIELYEKGAELYKGDFLKNNDENWVIAYREYYHNVYIKLITALSDLYIGADRHEDNVRLCRRAIEIDPYREDLYYRLISSLYSGGHQAEALAAYNSATDTFYRKFAITPSDRLKGLYRTIISTTRSIETDIGIIKETLTEHGEASGAFSCEYEFFKDIYQLEARACARSGDSIYLGLITLSDSNDSVPGGKSLNKAIDCLTAAINETLRKGDVYSRYSISQYVLLLPSASFENIEMVMKRISSSFRRKYIKKDIVLNYRMQPLDPKA